MGEENGVRLDYSDNDYIQLFALCLIYAMQINTGINKVAHQTVKSAVPGSNPASLQPAETCQFLVGKSQKGWHDNCRLASWGVAEAKNIPHPPPLPKKDENVFFGTDPYPVFFKCGEYPQFAS